MRGMPGESFHIQRGGMLVDGPEALPATVAIGNLKFQRTAEIAEYSEAIAIFFETRVDVRIRAAPDRHDEGTVDSPFFQLVEDGLELLHLRQPIGFHMRNGSRLVILQAVILTMPILQKIAHP